MGYYSKHKLSVYPSRFTEAIRERITSVVGFDPFDGDRYKWYSEKSECAKVSIEHPLVLFSIEGEGEEGCDVWRRDYMGGEVVGRWTLPPIEVPKADKLLIEKAEKANQSQSITIE